jgi:hypothetical protein
VARASAGGIDAPTATGIVGAVMSTGTAYNATTAGTVTGAQSNLIASALQAEADTLQAVVTRGGSATNIESLSGSGSVKMGTQLDARATTSGAGSGAFGVLPPGSSVKVSNAGGMFFGQCGPSGSVSNGAIGAIVAFAELGTNRGVVTVEGGGSILLGPGIVSNKYSIVLGTNQMSHGPGSVTAEGGFYWGSDPVSTNPASMFDAAGTTAAATNAIDSVFIASKGGVTGGVLSVGTSVSNVNGTLYFPTNGLGGGTGSGISAETATNIARSVAFDSGVTPFVLTSATNVAITRLTGTNAYSLVMATNVTLTITTNGWTGAEVGRFSLDVSAGAFTLAFDTAVMTNTTVLDISTTKATPLYFRKPVGETVWRVRQ